VEITHVKIVNLFYTCVKKVYYCDVKKRFTIVVVVIVVVVGVVLVVVVVVVEVVVEVVVVVVVNQNQKKPVFQTIRACLITEKMLPKTISV